MMMTIIDDKKSNILDDNSNKNSNKNKRMTMKIM